MEIGDNRGEGDLTQVVDIDNVNDKAIIKSFEHAKSTPIGKGILVASAIKKIVNETYSIDDAEVIQSRIRVLHKQGILIEVPPSEYRKDKRKQYRLNEEFEYNYVCGPLPKEIRSKEIPIDVRRDHTEKLKKIVETWIKFFPTPEAGYPSYAAPKYQENIKKIQDLLLYPDLENHLPEMGYKVWSEWRDFKKELAECGKMEKDLYALVKKEVSKCFDGMQLRFISSEEYSIRDYDCYLLDTILYNTVLDYSGRIFDYDAYPKLREWVDDLRENTVLHSDNSAIWELRGRGELIRVPKEMYESLNQGKDRFLELLENIENSHLLKPGRELIKKVRILNRNREMMITELEEILHYYCFPGECKYLSGF